VATLVFLHAHPDDEALFTAGTMARASAEGHRVVLVVATSGDQGLAAGHFGEPHQLAETRAAELEESARTLGVSRTVMLGYGDSGLNGEAPIVPGRPMPFTRVPLDQVVSDVAQVLRDESADVLTSYDPAGGYGHPDHRRVHEAGRLAAAAAGTPVVLEATIPREPLATLVRLGSRLYPVPPEFDPSSYARAYTHRRDITHRVDVSGYLNEKRAAMSAHASQATADDADRTLAAFLRLPRPAFWLVFRREWYVRRPFGDVPPPSLFTPAR